MNVKTSGELDYLESLIGSGIRPGLERMRAMLEVAGHPERMVPAVLVAGTNGKGSTAATLASILNRAGCRTGLYTSPHLVRLEERWKIDGHAVAEESLRGSVNELRRHADQAEFSPTYFEALTLLAFLLFRDHECDVAVLEVGMGGRLDATNVVDPLLSVITGIELDHQEWLGETIEQIALEKAGIARGGSPLLANSRWPEALEAISRRCGEVGCDLHVLGDEVAIDEVHVGLESIGVRMTTKSAEYHLHSRLTGEHQVENLALAVRGAELLSGRFRGIDLSAITEGVAATRWRGRLESFMLPDRLVLVDGAHNPSGAEAAARFIDRFLPRPRLLVFGALGDKDVRSMLESLSRCADRMILTAPDSDRAIDPATLMEMLGGAVPAEVIRNDAEAIEASLRREEIGSVIICGSLYLAGTAVRILDQIEMPRDERSSPIEISHDPPVR
jgi:dihydrofolate synthase / folylpolyglutamate synthase